MSENQSSRQTHRSPSLLDNAYSHTWYVGFGRGYHFPRWQKLFCKPEWSHCFCFAQAGPVVQIVNPGWDRVEIGIRGDEDGGPLLAEDFAHDMGTGGNTILRITHSPERIKYRSIFAPNCVSLVKVILGYNTGFFEYNPERLFYHMLRNGGELIYA